jgi:hypothetical protein
MRRSTADLTHDHLTGMEAQAYGEGYPALPREARIELPDGFRHPEPRPHRPRGVIFVRPGIAKVDQQPIAEILRNMPVIALNHSGAGALIGPHHLAPLFGVELAGEHRRVHQITEQHRELAAFGLWGTRFG